MWLKTAQWLDWIEIKLEHLTPDEMKEWIQLHLSELEGKMLAAANAGEYEKYEDQQFVLRRILKLRHVLLPPLNTEFNSIL